MTGSSEQTAVPVAVAHGVDFAAFFPFEALLPFIDHYAADRTGRTPQQEAEDRRAYWALMEQHFYPTLRGFLTALKEKGVIGPIPFSGGRSTWMMDDWNSMATDGPRYVKEPDAVWRTILSNLSHVFVFEAAYYAAKRIKTGADRLVTAKEHYAALVDRVNAGNVDWWNINGEEECFITGERYKANIVGWKLTMGTIDDGQFVPLSADAERPPVVEVEVTFPTGQLLIADWLRVQPFSGIVDANQWDRLSINCVAGREAQTEFYAKEFGFLSAHVGGCYPTMLETDGVFAFGELDEDAKPTFKGGRTAKKPRYHGYIATDYRAVTIIDRETLTAIAARTVGREEAERLVAACAAEHGVKEVAVAPGAYRLYFSGAYYDFAKHFRTDAVDFGSNFKPRLVLSPKPLL